MRSNAFPFKKGMLLPGPNGLCTAILISRRSASPSRPIRTLVPGVIEIGRLVLFTQRR